ncbi:MAG: tetratricopeptide repeat protein, partial [Vicinamibacterales bacterium]
PNQIPALRKFVELCVDGGLEATMSEAQAQLADAYLTTGQAAEARATAEDLVAREPWVHDHIARFRRALVMLRVSDPDSVIAERLGGQAPFLATDLFASVSAPVDEATPAHDLAPGHPVEDLPALDHAGFQARRSEDIGATPDTTPDAAPIEPAADRHAKKLDSDGEIDLTNALGGLHEPATGSTEAPGGKNLDDVFKDVRDQVSQGGSDQSAQHMTLARTYLEMGMPDQALVSLNAASESPRFRFEATSLIGRIYKDRGEAAQAVEWLERAFGAPAPTPDEGWSVAYDLGTVLEHQGETARALALYLALQAEAGNYRDVAERVERLARVGTETETGG